MSKSFKIFPADKAVGRRYRWVTRTGGDNLIEHAKGVLTAVEFREDGFVAFFTDGRQDDYTFGFSASWFSWREEGDDIILVARDRAVGEYIFSPR